MRTFSQIREVINEVWEILSGEDLDEKTAEGLLDFLLDLRNKNTPFSINKELTKILGAVANKFIESKHICTKVLSIFSSTAIVEEGKSNKI